MAHLLVAVIVVVVAASVLVVRHVRRRTTGRCWLPLREAMLHDAATLPATYLAQIHTRPEPETGGQVMATDLINGARGALLLRGTNFRPGSVVCFTWTAEGPQIRAWMSGRLWTACTSQAERGRRRAARAATRKNLAREGRAEREIRTAADEAVAAAEQILRDHSPR